MPLYEYQCKECGHRFERILQSFSSPDVKECPVCEGEVERLLSAPAVQFKGSGFYSTDYGAKPSAKTGQSAGETSGNSASSDGASSSSEKQAAPKAEAASTATPAAKTGASG